MSDVEDDGLPSCEEGQGRGGEGGGGEESNAGSSAGSPAALSPPPSKGCLKVLPERRSVSPSRVRILEHQNIVSFGGVDGRHDSTDSVVSSSQHEEMELDEVQKSRRRAPQMQRQHTKESLRAQGDQQRAECLRQFREMLVETAGNKTSGLTQAEIVEFLAKKDVTTCFFKLFDHDFEGSLDQAKWLQILRGNLARPTFNHLSNEAKESLLEMLDSLSEEICKQVPIFVDTFHVIVNSKGVTRRIFRLADVDGTGVVSVQQLMDAIITLSKSSDSHEFSVAQVAHLQRVFQQFVLPGDEVMCIDQFKKMMESSSDFFAERVFKLFDQDGKGSISMTEFVDAMSQLSQADDCEKIVFLFKIYDTEDDGLLSDAEIEFVMSECLRESGINLPESDIRDLSQAIIDEGKGDPGEDGLDDEGLPDNVINIDQLKRAFSKHPEMLENFTFILSKWLTPPGEEGKKASRDPQQGKWQTKLSHAATEKMRAARKNWQLYSFLGLLALVTLLIIIIRACSFIGMRGLDGRQNWFYMTSRASGKCLVAHSVIIFILVLRISLTHMRNLGWNSLLPLDEHIYLHKVVGVLIFVLSWIHTIMHLLNFWINVQPDPIKTLEMNRAYWGLPESIYGNASVPIWSLVYDPPEGCQVQTDCTVGSSTDVKNYNGLCQVCDDPGHAFSYIDWVFTMRPGVFGLIGGLANPTGVALIIIDTFMTVGSLPAIRKSRFVRLFYIIHLMYYPYMILLILHAPVYWKCILGPGVVFLLEKAYSAYYAFKGEGKTTVVEGIPLSSRVTKLVVKRPPKFKFTAGDYVFVRISEISSYEWHPFTISSAPEQVDTLTLHIRGVGHWTNKLYDHYENEKLEGQELFRAVKSRLSQTRNSLAPGAISSKRRQSLAPWLVASKQKQGGLPVLDAVAGLASDSSRGSAWAGGADARRGSIWAGGVAEDDRIIVPSRFFERHRLEIQLAGPYGAPSSSFFQAQHTVLIATGIGVTPFSSILQSIMFRYMHVRRTCPNCEYCWTDDLGKSLGNLTKVDFFWINRSQKAFEWFISLLDKMEQEQLREGSNKVLDKFLDFHLYMTKALQRTDMRAVGLQLAMDLLHEKEQRDVVTKLKVQTNAGRPNWNRIFHRLKEENKGEVTIFYCGNPNLAKALRKKCQEFGFKFRKEVF